MVVGVEAGTAEPMMPLPHPARGSTRTPPGRARRAARVRFENRWYRRWDGWRLGMGLSGLCSDGGGRRGNVSEYPIVFA